MRHAFTFALSLAAAAGLLAGGGSSASAQSWGDLTGKFMFDGDAPEAAKVDITRPEDKEAFAALGLVDESLKVGEGGGLANVVIYVKTPSVKVHPDLEKEAPAKVELDNKGGAFHPRIRTLWLNGKQVVEAKNSDPVPHNTNCQPLFDSGFNPQLPPGAKFEMKFSREQLIPQPITCTAHPWMKGFLLPRKNPYVAVTDDEGNFTIKNLPAGTKLEFQVWHEKAGFLAAKKEWDKGKMSMTIKPGKNDLGTIKVDPKLLKK